MQPSTIRSRLDALDMLPHPLYPTIDVYKPMNHVVSLLNRIVISDQEILPCETCTGIPTVPSQPRQQTRQSK